MPAILRNDHADTVASMPVWPVNVTSESTEVYAVSTTRRSLKPESTPVGSGNRGGENQQQRTDRCKATHDVPYTQRCVLDFDHTEEWATIMGTEATPHKDKAGRVW